MTQEIDPCDFEAMVAAGASPTAKWDRLSHVTWGAAMIPGGHHLMEVMSVGEHFTVHIGNCVIKPCGYLRSSTAAMLCAERVMSILTEDLHLAQVRRALGLGDDAKMGDVLEAIESLKRSSDAKR